MKRIVLVVLLAACSAPVAPVVVVVEEPLVVGIASNSLEEGALRMVKDLKVGHIRTTIYPDHWNDDPVYRARTVSGIRRAKAMGLETLVVVHTLPESWGSSDLASFMAERARELPEVEVWQVGNEIPFGGGREHAQWHAESYRAIKAVRPEALVVTMAVVGSMHHFDLPFWREFLEERPPMDALVVHAYGWPLAPTIEGIAERLRHYGVPLWITEFGSNREMIPMWEMLDETHEWEAEQGREWVSSLEAASKAGYARAYGYALQTDESRETHGIVRPDGTYRPAAEMLRSRNED